MPWRITTIPAFVRTGILLLALPGFLGAVPQTSSNKIDAIGNALQNKAYDKALEMLGPELQKSPGDARLWAMQGVAYAGMNKAEEALTSFHKSLKLSPDYLPALQGAAQVEFQAGSPAAIPIVQHILQLHPGDQTAHGMLAILEYQQGNCPEATAHFEKAGSLFDSRPTALRAYGICLVKLKHFERSISVFQQVAALEPDDPQARRLLASVQLMAHKPQDALATLKPLLANDADAQTLDLASAAYEESGDSSQAVATLRQAILLDPQNVNLYLDFAHLCYAHDSFQVGINVLSDGIGLQPKVAPLYLARGVLYVQLAQYEHAEADFDKAHELDPRQALSSAGQSLVAVQENDSARALKTVQTKLQRNPNDPLLLYLQADFLLQTGAAPGSPEFQLALRSAHKAVELQPSLADARDVLAKLYLQSGQYKEAVDECRKALDGNPKDQTAVYHLIQALRKSGQTEEIPGLLKKLAQLREQAAREENQRKRYKLVEDEAQPKAE
jgi:tetratricopeptide (TPR) repeat protein